MIIYKEFITINIIIKLMNKQNEKKIQFVHKDPGYGNDTPSPSRIAPPPPRPKK